MAAPPVPAPDSAALQPHFNTFRNVLYEAAGIFFPDANSSRLLTHVATRMKAVGQSDPQAYLALLQRGRGPSSELAAFFNQVTVNETYFFREIEQYDVLRDRVLPQLFEQRRSAGRDKVNIWSAACSSGEEAYGIAILLREHFPGELSRISVTGFDINSQVIDQARRGAYGSYSVRHCSPEQLTTHFRKEGELCQLLPEVRRLVTFQVLNMSDAHQLRLLPPPDLILCRNALIYFDKSSKAQVVANFRARIRPDGYFLLSRTESLFGIEHGFKLVNLFRVVTYRPA